MIYEGETVNAGVCKVNIRSENTRYDCRAPSHENINGENDE